MDEREREVGRMEYIASLSYGKDSCAMLEVIHQHNMPLDRIVHVEIMATDTIPADLPPMMEFKAKADKIIKKRYGIKVEHIHAPYTYEEYFYSLNTKGKNVGLIHGFPMTTKQKAWCNKRLKIEVLQKYQKYGTWYIGIAADEPARFGDLSPTLISPLVENNIAGWQSRNIAERIGLLSPTYTTSDRGGCWFCHNQPLSQLRKLRHDYPEKWALLLKWDKDSNVSFLANGKNGTTVHDLDKRFYWEDQQVSMNEILSSSARNKIVSNP